MKKNDIILILVFLCISGIIFMIYKGMHKESGAYVVISVDDEEYARLPLNEDTRFEIAGTNVVVVSDGKVYMESAGCPDQICVKHRKIAYNGESIICLPNRVIVKITGGQKPAIDAGV